MISATSLLLIILAYVGLLYVIAAWAESGSERAQKLTSSAAVYALSLAIYCTSWTFFGSVGIATHSSILMLSVYLGPTLLMIVIWPLMQRILLIKQIYRVTSIADFLSARFNRSVSLAGLAALVAMIGIVPYLALQLKAINTSIDLLLAVQTQAKLTIAWLVWLGVALFTIVFGIRHLDPTERHPGMMLALAVEGLVKLAAMLTVGVFVCFVMFDSPLDIFAQLQQQMPEAAAKMASKPAFVTWFSYLLLAGTAFMLLPRQFHVLVVENPDANHVKKIQWWLPVYLFLMTLFVTPIAAAGLLLLGPETADSYMLSIPMLAGQELLTIFVFIGGFSASMAMLMVSGMTLSTMFSNHLVLPFIQRFRPDSRFKKYLLQSRWLAVFIVLGAGQIFYLYLGESYMLVNMGMISFCAVLQFLPLVIAGLYWPQVTSKGAFAGLCAGFGIWAYCLILPAIMKSGWINADILLTGPFGIAWLHPEHLLGSEMDKISHGAFWSMAANISALVLGSLYSKMSGEEKRYNAEFMDVMAERVAEDEAIMDTLPRDIDIEPKLKLLKGIFGQYLTPEHAENKLAACLTEADLNEVSLINVQELANLERTTERQLSGITGAAVAHMVVTQSTLYSESEIRTLERYYGQLLAELKISPAQLRQQLNYSKEKELLAKRYSEQMEGIVDERTRELQETLDKLKRAQAHLIETEKQASLGKMVAGIAHEINTPIGVCVTAASHLHDEVVALKKMFAAGDLSEEEFQHFMQTCTEAMDIILKNNARASKLIQSFKRVAVDQSSEQIREFGLKEYLEEILMSLRPALKKVPHEVKVICSNKLTCNTYPGGLSQVITNLIMNSLLHAFKPEQVGKVTIEISASEGQILMNYSDDGIGLDEDGEKNLFDPFYTTKRNQGGSGLGTHLVYNLVTQKLKGEIDVETSPGKGLCYHIRFPQNIED
ncbi:putative Fusion protein of Na-dependent permease domain and histidine kinase domain of two-component sensor [Shewanella benthica]|uniref:histidine kinase n=1 Tax=Shewanella benthica TaxID=43661 RepID=A0A330M6F0_9GAMM|nr:sensor histidine kinase [Shewanella benthica]SQH75337.1 putative Fusion protein of Na-dependent permease domain and histidine kinase domain of two-component sensor [Shewanella benthica]